MMWAAMGVFGAITSAVNHAWGVEKQPSYLKHKLISFMMLVAASLLLLAGLLLVSAINVAEARWFAVIIARAPGLLVLQGWAVKSASTVIFILLVGLIFYFVPNATVRFRDVWVGAVVTGLLWRGALAGFSRYVRDLTSLQRPRLDRRGRRLPGVDLHLRGDTSCTASKSPPPTRAFVVVAPTRFPRRRRRGRRFSGCQPSVSALSSERSVRAC